MRRRYHTVGGQKIIDEGVDVEIVPLTIENKFPRLKLDKPVAIFCESKIKHWAHYNAYTLIFLSVLCALILAVDVVTRLVSAV